MPDAVVQQLSDDDLLAEFSARRSEAAFEELVRRHGPLVYSVCLRTLVQRQDAEDATQAVFLTLALKAGALKGRTNLGGWLHRTAWNVARRARSAQAVKTRLEREAGNMAVRASTPEAEDEWRDLQPLLDEELDKLPEKFRLPLVLHHLEGRTKDETARLLKENPGTISARLDRAREQLRERLMRRGVTVSSGAVSALLLHVAEPALPQGLIAATAKSAVLAAAAGKLSAGMASGHVLALAKGTVGAMGISKTTVVVVTVLLVAMLGSGVALIQGRLSARAKRHATFVELRSIQMSLVEYQMIYSVYPPDVAPNGAKSSAALYYSWDHPEMKHLLAQIDVAKQPDGTVAIVDVWGQPLEYKRLADGTVDVYSMGEPGGNAPIRYWTEE